MSSLLDLVNGKTSVHRTVDALRKGGGRIEKGGEGSRGGNVIGHTTSGKPIYAATARSPSSDAHTHKDHAEAHTALKVAAANAPISGGAKGRESLYLEARKHKTEERKKLGYSESEAKETAHGELHEHHKVRAKAAPPGSADHKYHTEAAEDHAQEKAHHWNVNRQKAGYTHDLAGKKYPAGPQRSGDHPGVMPKSMDDNPDLVKGGGPFIGKRGGKWADPQHKIAWKDAKHAGKPAPTEKAHDEHGARELELHIDNTEHLNNETKRTPYGEHQTQRGAIHANLAKKIAAGKYDHAQAGKLFQHHVDAASKHYSKEYGAPAGGGHHFDAATRRHVAREMADQFHEEVKDGDHDHHVESGVHAKRAKAGGGLSSMAEAHGKAKKDADSPRRERNAATLAKMRGEKHALTAQGHLDEHDRHRGNESMHKQKAKQAKARGDQEEAAHHAKEHDWHGKMADAHNDLAEKKRWGKAGYSDTDLQKNLAAVKKLVDSGKKVEDAIRAAYPDYSDDDVMAAVRAYGAKFTEKEHPQLVRSMPADNSLMGYSDEIMNFYSQG